MEACLAELRRNSGLRRLIGIESEDQVPKKWNVSRFQEKLGQEPHVTHLQAIFSTIVQRLGSVVSDLGRNTAGDATGLSARRKDEAGAEAEVAAGLPQASGGRKEYTDDAGNVTEVVEWFGFKLHLLVDVKHEVALSYAITDTKAGDGERCPRSWPRRSRTCRRDASRRWPTTKRPTPTTCTSSCLRKESSRSFTTASCGKKSPCGCCWARREFEHRL
jgi:hypothetical protein